MDSVQYPITGINDKKSPGANWSYVTFNLGGNMYIVNSKIAGILTAHGVTYYYDKKFLAVRPPWLEGDDELAPGWDGWKPGWDTWEMGEGYSLTVKFFDFSSIPSKARLVLKRNGVELDDVWLKQNEVYRYAPTEENDMQKLITYLDAVFAGSQWDVIQLRYTTQTAEKATGFQFALAISIILAVYAFGQKRK